MIWITKIIANPPPQFSSNNTLQPTPQYHFTATWDSHSWMKMENHPHNGFHAPSKSVTKTMSTVPASVVAIIQLDSTQPLFKFLKWSLIGKKPNIAQRLAQRWNTCQHVFQHFETELPYFLSQIKITGEINCILNGAQFT